MHVLVALVNKLLLIIPNFCSRLVTNLIRWLYISVNLRFSTYNKDHVRRHNKSTTSFIFVIDFLSLFLACWNRVGNSKFLHNGKCSDMIMYICPTLLSLSVQTLFWVFCDYNLHTAYIHLIYTRSSYELFGKKKVKNARHNGLCLHYNIRLKSENLWEIKFCSKKTLNCLFNFHFKFYFRQIT